MMKDVSWYTMFWLLESIVTPLQNASHTVKSAIGKWIFIFASIYGTFYFTEIKYKGLESIHTGKQKYKLQDTVNMAMEHLSTKSTKLYLTSYYLLLKKNSAP
jgi:hypothetical protein